MRTFPYYTGFLPACGPLQQQRSTDSVTDAVVGGIRVGRTARDRRGVPERRIRAGAQHTRKLQRDRLSRRQIADVDASRPRTPCAAALVIIAGIAQLGGHSVGKDHADGRGRPEVAHRERIGDKAAALRGIGERGFAQNKVGFRRRGLHRRHNRDGIVALVGVGRRTRNDGGVGQQSAGRCGHDAAKLQKDGLTGGHRPERIGAVPREPRQPVKGILRLGKAGGRIRQHDVFGAVRAKVGNGERINKHVARSRRRRVGGFW